MFCFKLRDERLFNFSQTFALAICIFLISELFIYLSVLLCTVIIRIDVYKVSIDIITS